MMEISNLVRIFAVNMTFFRSKDIYHGKSMLNCERRVMSINGVSVTR